MSHTNLSALVPLNWWWSIWLISKPKMWGESKMNDDHLTSLSCGNEPVDLLFESIVWEVIFEYSLEDNTFMMRTTLVSVEIVGGLKLDINWRWDSMFNIMRLTRVTEHFSPLEQFLQPGSLDTLCRHRTHKWRMHQNQKTIGNERRQW